MIVWDFGTGKMVALSRHSEPAATLAGFSRSGPLLSEVALLSFSLLN